LDPASHSGALYYGDNLDVLRRWIPDESVDLVYLDPPFNSNASYNVLFAEQDGSRSAAQIKAFGDTWRWDQAAAAAYQETVEAGGDASRAMHAFRTVLGDSNMLAYLAMMAPRLMELRRVLNPTGSLYLHCDPTASHYLKLLLDATFGPRSFRTEIVWKRSSAHSDTKQGRAQHGRVHDVLFFYTKGEEWVWNPLYTAYGADYVASEYRHVTPGGRCYKQTDLTAAKPGGDTSFDWRAKRATGSKQWTSDLEDEWRSPVDGWEYRAIRPYHGRYWAYSKEGIRQFAKDGRLHYRSTGMPRLMQFADEMPGVSLQDVWTDIAPISAKAAERLGYPTQKPEALLERIIKASTDEGQTVLDPFCGCGTAVAVAQRLNRRWIGIDLTFIATNLVKNRLAHAFGESLKFEEKGEPTTVEDAAELARSDPYQFQAWALGLVNARVAGQKRGADHGIDGRLLFHEKPGGRTRQVIISVKSGHTGVAHVRDLRGVLERENAEIGLLITMQDPTRQMRAEAASAGHYRSGSEGAGSWGHHPKLQLLTVGELLEGKRIDMPPLTGSLTFKRAPRVDHPAQAPALFG
jgi:DNA modification methylase